MSDPFVAEVGKVFEVIDKGDIGAYETYTPPDDLEPDAQGRKLRGESGGKSIYRLYKGDTFRVTDIVRRVEVDRVGGKSYEVVKGTVIKVGGKDLTDKREYYLWTVFGGIKYVQLHTPQNNLPSKDIKKDSSGDKESTDKPPEGVRIEVKAGQTVVLEIKTSAKGTSGTEKEKTRDHLPQDVDDNWILPVNGRTRNYTNHPRIHRDTTRVSIDIDCLPETPVKAANHGEVIEVHKNPAPTPWNEYRDETGQLSPKRANQRITQGNRSYSYLDHPGVFSGFGNYIIIRHYRGSNADGTRKVFGTTAYSHLLNINVNKGDAVTKGQQIGNSGGNNMSRAKNNQGYFYFTNFGPDGTGWKNSPPNTGPLSVAHLHYERPASVSI
ncbi:MAG: M23 family metallopeptidase [bacterium]|nr:M23 family metallopeptidase [bacterium]